MLRADHLAARYPGQPTSAPALADVSLHVARGERVLLLGPNGAGKSTFVRVCAGLMRPSGGRVSVADHPVRQARHLVGLVGHATLLYDELTAAENLRLFGELYAVADPRNRARLLLERVGIAHLADEQVGRLSRGQQQRVSLARALVHDPPVLLLDEPDTGLDVAAVDLLADVLAAEPRAVVLTTHHLAAGVRLGTRAVVLARGRVRDERASLSPADEAALGDLLHNLAGGSPAGP